MVCTDFITDCTAACPVIVHLLSAHYLRGLSDCCKLSSNRWSFACLGLALSDILASLISMLHNANRIEESECCVCKVSFDEFTKVYHSDEWLNVRLVNMARQTLITAFSDQIALYKRQALEMREHVQVIYTSCLQLSCAALRKCRAELHSTAQVLNRALQDIAENNDKFLSNSEIKEKISPQLLMKRRALQRSKSVRSAMNKFWKALEAHTIAGAYVTKELYLRYNYKLNRAFFDTDEGSRPNTAATDVSGLANAEEDWEAECKRADTLLTKTKHMQHREAKGLPLTEPIPDRVEVLSYSVFFDSIFELADVYIMMQGDLKLLTD